MIWNGIEKRRFVRANFPCKITIYMPSQHIISTHTENIGAGGVRVVISERLDTSSEVGLEIKLGEEPIRCQGRVVWAIESDDTSEGKPLSYDTGIEFYQINEEDRSVINNFVEASAVEEK